MLLDTKPAQSEDFHKTDFPPLQPAAVPVQPGILSITGDTGKLGNQDESHSDLMRTNGGSNFGPGDSKAGK